MFIICGIPFHIVENPFFINFIKSLNPAYQPPSRELLSGRLMDVELSQINRQIDSELEYASNLILGKSIFLTISIYNTRRTRLILILKILILKTGLNG